MPDLQSLLKARLGVIAERADVAATIPSLELSAQQASALLEAGKARLARADADHLAADRAIHDVLAEKGMHSLVDEKDGTVVIYAASEQAPGWFATHPIPGKSS